MREIKFRGVDLDTGEYVYAELGEVSAEINPGYLTFITDEGIFTVDATTITQLIGRDADGKEIYEGDYVELVIDGKQYVYRAHFEGFAIADDGRFINAKKLSETRLVA